MKIRTLVSILILVLAVLVIAGGCATKRKAISEKDLWNALSGTWVNTDYSGKWTWFEQKLIVYPDGKFEYYPLTTDTKPTRQGYFLTITKAWIDSEGVIWYKAIIKTVGTIYELGKISESGNTWESVSDSINTPTEWDTSKTRYEFYDIYYRQ